MIQHIFKTIPARDFKFGMQLRVWNAYQLNKSFSPKGAWLRSRDP